MVDQNTSAGALDQISVVPDNTNAAKKRVNRNVKNLDGSQTGSTDTENKTSKKPKSK